MKGGSKSLNWSLNHAYALELSWSRGNCLNCRRNSLERSLDGLSGDTLEGSGRILNDTLNGSGRILKRCWNVLGSGGSRSGSNILEGHILKRVHIVRDEVRGRSHNIPDHARSHTSSSCETLINFIDPAISSTDSRRYCSSCLEHLANGAANLVSKATCSRSNGTIDVAIRSCCNTVADCSADSGDLFSSVSTDKAASCAAQRAGQTSQ